MNLSTIKELTIPEGRVIALSINGIPVWEANVATEGLKYTLLDDGTYSVTGYDGTDTDIAIPAKHKQDGVEAAVTIIDSYVFSGTSITSVVIPESITKIRNGAFKDCYYLTKIEYNAIECSDLSSTGNTFKHAGNNAGGVEVIIGAKVRKIPAYLFYPSAGTYRPLIKSVTFRDNSVCENVGDNAFSRCDMLTTVILGNNITSVGHSAFRSCHNLESINIPENLTKIDGYAFYGCMSLKNITIPISVTSIGSYTFGQCRTLETIYCEAKSQPEGWDSNWLGDCSAEVVWGYESEPETPSGETITDLTGYTWVGDDLLSPVSRDSIGPKSINFTCNGKEYRSFYRLVWSDESEGFGENYLEYTSTDETLTAYDAWNYPSQPWRDEAYKTIQITGGADATNAELIAWLQANGTLSKTTDLTNTTWKLNSLNCTAGQAIYIIDFNVIAYDGQPYNGYQLGVGYEGFYFSGEGWGNGGYFTQPTANFVNYGYPTAATANIGDVITITGGTDATNTSLISWLQANGTLTKNPNIVYAGTYLFNEKINISPYNDYFSQDIVFSSFGNSFNSIAYRNGGGPEVPYTVLSYLPNIFDAYYFSTDTWSREEARTITIETPQVVSQDFYTWFTENADKQETITDLTNTTWFVPSGWEVPASYGKFQIDFIIREYRDAGGSSYNEYTGTYNYIGFGYSGYDADPDNMSDIGNSAFTDPSPNCINTGMHYMATIYNNTSFEIDITGGRDTTNTTLIEWLQENGKQLITFTISGTTYQAENGMTWAEWCDSSYNTLGLVNAGNEINNDGSTSYKNLKYTNTTIVNPSDIIIVNYAYILSGGAGA